jgi:hypothetical protein
MRGLAFPALTHRTNMGLADDVIRRSPRGASAGGRKKGRRRDAQHPNALCRLDCHRACSDCLPSGGDQVSSFWAGLSKKTNTATPITIAPMP